MSVCAECGTITKREDGSCLLCSAREAWKADGDVEDSLDGADLDTLEGVKRWMRNFFNGCDQPSADDLIERFEQILRRDIAKSPNEVDAAYEAGFAFAKAHYTEETKAEILASLLAYNPPRFMRVSGPLVDGMETDIRFLKVFTEDDIRNALVATERSQ